jgi:hypothetical protein
MSTEADRIAASISIGSRQLSGMQQHLSRLEGELRLQRERVEQSRRALEALRSRLRVLEAPAAAGDYGVRIINV